MSFANYFQDGILSVPKIDIEAEPIEPDDAAQFKDTFEYKSRADVAYLSPYQMTPAGNILPKIALYTDNLVRDENQRLSGHISYFRSGSDKFSQDLIYFDASGNPHNLQAPVAEWAFDGSLNSYQPNSSNQFTMYFNDLEIPEDAVEITIKITTLDGNNMICKWASSEATIRNVLTINSASYSMNVTQNLLDPSGLDRNIDILEADVAVLQTEMPQKLDLTGGTLTGELQSDYLIKTNDDIEASSVYVFSNQYGIGTLPNALNVFGLNAEGINFEVQDASNAMCIKENGSVGIGTSNPVGTLDVSGSFAVLGLQTSLEGKDGDGVSLYIGGDTLQQGTDFKIWNTDRGGVGTSAGRALVHETIGGTPNKANSELIINYDGDYGAGVNIQSPLNLGGELNLGGHTISNVNGLQFNAGNIVLEASKQNTIKNIATPVAPSDCATKSYVDAHTPSGTKMQYDSSYSGISVSLGGGFPFPPNPSTYSFGVISQAIPGLTGLGDTIEIDFTCTIKKWFSGTPTSYSPKTLSLFLTGGSVDFNAISRNCIQSEYPPIPGTERRTTGNAYGAYLSLQNVNQNGECPDRSFTCKWIIPTATINQYNNPMNPYPDGFIILSGTDMTPLEINNSTYADMSWSYKIYK